MHGIALVDYDNVRDRPRTERLEPVRADHELWATDLVSDVTLACRRALPDLVELDLRFYGGWIVENGRWSPSAEWLLPLWHRSAVVDTVSSFGPCLQPP